MQFHSGICWDNIADLWIVALFFLYDVYKWIEV